MPTATRLAQMTRLRSEVSAMASALEAAEPMPGGGTLQATMDTAWHALIALHLGIEDWLASQPENDSSTFVVDNARERIYPLA